MNIREHIEAGHYPKDEKGRALVPMRAGGTAVIVATDLPHEIFPIFGWTAAMGTQRQWQAGGRNSLSGEGAHDLLPPPPHKVKVTGKIRYTNGDFAVWDFHSKPGRMWKEGEEVSFATEYEEPWS